MSINPVNAAPAIALPHLNPRFWVEIDVEPHLGQETGLDAYSYFRILSRRFSSSLFVRFATKFSSIVLHPCRKVLAQNSNISLGKVFHLSLPGCV